MPEKVNSSGTRSDVIIILISSLPVIFGTLDSSRTDVFKNIGLFDYIFSFSNYRPLPIPEVPLSSPKAALNFHLRLGKAYIFG